MSQKTLIALALLVGGLLAFIWFVERELPSSEDRAASGQRIFRLEAHQVESITLELGENSVHLERAKVSATTVDGEKSSDDPDLAPDWRMIHPHNAAGDQQLINRFVDALVTLEKERILQDVDPASLGLEPPRAVVRLKTSNGDRVLRVGSEVPASNTMIVQVEGVEDVYVVRDSIWSSISKEPGDWRDRSLFKGSRAAIQRISLTSNGRRLLLAKRGDDFWIEAPIVDRASENHLASLLTAIVGLKIDAFVDSPELDREQMALDPARAVLEVVLAGELSPLRLDIGGPTDSGEESFYAQIESQVVIIKSDWTEMLTRELDEWRERSLTSLKVYEIDRVSIEEGGSSLSLERADGNWKRDDEEIGYSSVSDLLYAAVGLEANEILGEDEDRQPDPKSALLKIVLSSSDVEESVSFFPSGPDGILAAVSGRDALFLLSVDALDQLREKLTEVRVASPVEVSEDAESDSDAAEGS